MDRIAKPLRAIFLSLVVITAVVWLLRGVSLLAFMPGGVLLVLVFLTLVTGIALALEALR